MTREGLGNVLAVWYCQGKKCGRSNPLQTQVCDYCHEPRK